MNKKLIIEKRKIDKQLLDKIDQRKYFSVDNTNYHFNDKILTY